MGRKRQRKEATIQAGGLDPGDAAALAEEDEFAKELAAAREIMQEQQHLRGGLDGGSDDECEEEEDGVNGSGNGKAKPRAFINNQVREDWGKIVEYIDG